MTDNPIVLRNGTLKDPATGRFLPGSRPTTAIRSSEQASAMAHRRHRLAKIAARKALAEKAASHGAQRSPIAAVEILAGEMYEASLDGLRGDLVVNADGSEWTRVDRRGAVLTAKMALQLADMAPASEQQQGALAPAVTLTVTAEGLAFLRGLVGGQVIEGEAREVEGSEYAAEDDAA